MHCAEGATCLLRPAPQPLCHYRFELLSCMEACRDLRSANRCPSSLRLGGRMDIPVCLQRCAFGRPLRATAAYSLRSAPLHRGFVFPHSKLPILLLHQTFLDRYEGLILDYIRAPRGSKKPAPCQAILVNHFSTCMQPSAILAASGPERLPASPVVLHPTLSPCGKHDDHYRV